MTDNKTISETDIQEIVQEGVGKKKNVIMDSQVLTSLMNCARLTDFRFNLNLQSIRGKSNSIECGSIVHKFLEVYNISRIKGINQKDAIGFGMAAAQLYISGCPDCTDFKPRVCDCCKFITDDIYGPPNPACLKCGGAGEIKKPLCGHKINDFPGVKNTPPDSEGYKTGWKWALTTCEQYMEHYKNDHWVPLEVEIVKSKILYEDDDLRIMWKAKLDLVADTNQGIYPIDHKTMKQRRPNNKLNNQFIGQCLISDTNQMIVNKIGFQTTLKPEEKFERRPVSYTSEQMTEWVSETLPFYARMLLMYAETGYFPPNYSNCEGKYGNCAFKEVCEANPDMREYELKNSFVVGPEWNPTNDEDGE